MLNELRNFVADRLDVHQLIALAAYGKMLRAEYELHNVEAPEWLDRNLKAVNREIAARNADKIEQLLKEKRAKFDALKTPAEKKAELQKQIKDLEKQAASL